MTISAHRRHGLGCMLARAVLEFTHTLLNHFSRTSHVAHIAHTCADTHTPYTFQFPNTCVCRYLAATWRLAWGGAPSCQRGSGCGRQPPRLYLSWLAHCQVCPKLSPPSFATSELRGGSGWDDDAFSLQNVSCCPAHGSVCLFMLLHSPGCLCIPLYYPCIPRRSPVFPLCSSGFPCILLYYPCIPLCSPVSPCIPLYSSASRRLI